MSGNEAIEKAKEYRNAFLHRFSPRSLISIYHKYENGSIGFGLNNYLPSKEIMNNSVKVLDLLSDTLFIVTSFVKKEYNNQ